MLTVASSVQSTSGVYNGNSIIGGLLGIQFFCIGCSLSALLVLHTLRCPLSTAVGETVILLTLSLHLY